MALLTEHIPKHHGAGFAFEIIDLKFLRALQDFGTISTRLTESREVAFHVRHENRHTAQAEILSKRLERDRFPRAGGAGNQTVAVCHFGKQEDLFLRLGNENWFAHMKLVILSLIRRNCRVPALSVAD